MGLSLQLKVKHESSPGYCPLCAALEGGLCQKRGSHGDCRGAAVAEGSCAQPGVHFQLGSLCSLLLKST